MDMVLFYILSLYETYWFVYSDHVSHYKYTKTKEDIVDMRDNYLDWVKKYRDIGYEIFYTDKTWVFKNMSCNKGWVDSQGQ